MKTKTHYLVFAILVLVSSAASAVVPGAMEIVDTAMRASILSVVGTIQSVAIVWLSSLVLIQFLITQLGLLKSGAELEAVWGKLLGSLMWLGFCYYVMANGADFIDKVSQQFVGLGGTISGAGQFSASYILGWGVHLASSLLDAVDQAKGGGILAALDFLPSILAGVCALVILATAALIGFKVFLIKIEIALVIMMSPLSFAFLGLNALKDQGIAPFKSLISMCYRIVLLAIICKTMAVVGDNILSVLKNVSSGSITEIWNPIFAALFGYMLLGFLAFKSDSIAASLASGSTNLGTGDVAGAAAMGAAAGAAMASMGAAALGGASKASQSMTDVMSSMSGGSASGGGLGGAPLTSPPPPPQSPAGGGASGAAPAQFRTNSAGAPQPPDEASTSSAVPAQAATDSKAANAYEKENAKDQSKDAGAGIGGASGPSGQNPGQLPSQGKQDGKSFVDHLGTANQHMSQERATTSISMSAHHE